MTNSLQKERNEIIELFGLHFSSLFRIAPLAARILGVLMVDGCKSGLTFDALVGKLAASKSSISTNLNLLLKMEKIYYFTIAGDRKKYFKSAPLSDRLSNYLKIIESESYIINKIHNYREKTTSCAEEQCNLENISSYRNYLQEVEKSLQKTLAEFKKIEFNKSTE